ncbi:MAG: aldehyde reductase, partial [bacterium]|nr:aldehyde reductase [bacterium]
RDDSKVFNENDWSKIDKKTRAYPKSKTMAERAAWDFVNNQQGEKKMELAVINPSVVLGPVLDEDYGTSGEVVRKLMRREIPGCPNIGFSVVDVRDVASAHLAAMTTPEAAGQRFCCTREFTWIREIAQILDKHFAPRGYKIPTRRFPDFLVRIAALFNSTVRMAAGNLGKRTDFSNERIREVLDWKPRPLEEMVVSMGESLIENGVV